MRGGLSPEPYRLRSTFWARGMQIYKQEEMSKENLQNRQGPGGGDLEMRCIEKEENPWSCILPWSLSCILPWSLSRSETSPGGGGVEMGAQTDQERASGLPSPHLGHPSCQAPGPT